MNDFQSLPDAGYLTVSFTPNVFSVGLVGSMTTSRAPTIKKGLGSHKLGVYIFLFVFPNYRGQALEARVLDLKEDA